MKNRRSTPSRRRTLSLKRETVRRLSHLELGQVAGAGSFFTWGCDGWSIDCPSNDTQCSHGTMSKFC